MSAERQLSIAFVDVGQGDSTIVLPPEGEGNAIVFDVGTDGWEVVQQLQTWGITTIEALVVSHFDLDHMGGLATVLDAFAGKVENVYFTPDRDLSDDHEEFVKAKAIVDHVIAGGQSGGWNVLAAERNPRPIASGGDWSVKILAPRGIQRLEVARGDSWDKANRYSAVLRVEMAGAVVLVGADAPLVTWSEVPADERKAAVFRIPHHGGALDDGGVPDGWDSKRLYDEVGMRVAVVSVGTNNPHGHPVVDPWVSPLLGRKGCRLACTQVTGRCHGNFDKGVVGATKFASEVKAARERWVPVKTVDSHFAEPLWRHYRQRGDDKHLRTNRMEMPCAGTVTVRIDEAGDIRVDPASDHVSYVAHVDRWDHPLCRGAAK